MGCATDSSPGNNNTPPGDGSSGSNRGSGSDGGSGSDDGGAGSGSDGVASFPTAHPRILLQGATQTRLKAAAAANTPQWKKMKSIVDSWVGGADIWGFESWNAALVGVLTGQQSYCTAAIADVDAQVSAAETAMASGQQPVVAADDYLDVGPMVGGLALVYDWCNTQVTSSQKTRWIAYADQALYNVWNHASAKWGDTSMPWTGWATDDPSDNYYYSFLRATEMMGLATKGEDPKADDWIAQFRTTKLAGEAWPTFDADLVGGCSREGTGYGVAMKGLWMLYDWWQATTGERIMTKTPHTHASMLAFVHQVMPTLDRVVPTGDQSRDSTASFFDYHRNYLQELAQMFSTESLAGRVKYLLANSSIPTMTSDFMVAWDFIYDNGGVASQPLTGLNTAYYAPGIGEVYARSGWDKHATWINLIAGPYTQSHAHQDQGSLMINKDGWLAYDAVVDSHSGLRQETTAHGLASASIAAASRSRKVGATISKLLAAPPGRRLGARGRRSHRRVQQEHVDLKVQREMVYLEPDVVVVYDRVTSDASTTQTWQLASPKQPAINGTTATFTTATHALHVQRLEPTSGVTASAYSMTSDPSGDYAGGFRLDEAAPGGDQRYLHVLSIDGAATSVTQPAPESVTVQMSGGHTATVTFNKNAIGGTLVLDGTSYPLSASVDTLPE